VNFTKTLNRIDARLINKLGDAALLDGAPLKGYLQTPWSQPDIGRLPTNLEEPFFVGRESDLAAAVEGSSLVVTTVQGEESFAVIKKGPYQDHRSMVIMILRAI